MEIVDFLFWVYQEYIVTKGHQAVLMKFKFGATKEIDFLAVNDHSRGMIYGWNIWSSNYSDQETSDIYHCCNAPIQSDESREFLSDILLELDHKSDSFPLPSLTLGIRELKYEIIQVEDVPITIKILSKGFHSIRRL